MDFAQEQNSTYEFGHCMPFAVAFHNEPGATIDSAGRVGTFDSLALTTTNIPVISYYDATNSALKLAVCNDAACSLPTISTLDAAGMWVAVRPLPWGPPTSPSSAITMRQRHFSKLWFVMTRPVLLISFLPLIPAGLWAVKTLLHSPLPTLPSSAI